MIERKFVAQNFKEFKIKNFVKDALSRVGLSSVKLTRTSLGEKIIVTALRPGLVVGRGGGTIQKLTGDLRSKFNLENPQIEIEEIAEFGLDATVVAETIVNQLERYGTQRFKGIGHKMVDAVMKSGALGVEILISGKIPSSRSKTWRFVEGYMKKCGDIAITGVHTAKEYARLKTGVVGVQVRIMPATTRLPDQITFETQQDNQKAQDEQEVSGEETQPEQVPEEKDKESVTKEAEKSQGSATKKSTKKATKKATKKPTKTSKKDVGDAIGSDEKEVGEK